MEIIESSALNQNANKNLTTQYSPLRSIFLHSHQMNAVDQGDVKYSIENGIATVEFHHPLSNSLPGKVLAKLADTITELFNIN